MWDIDSLNTKLKDLSKSDYKMTKNSSLSIRR